MRLFINFSTFFISCIISVLYWRHWKETKLLQCLPMWYIVTITWTSIRSFKFQSPVTFQYENTRVHHLWLIPDNPSNEPLVHSSHWQKLWYNNFTEYTCYEPEAFIKDNLISGVNTYRQILPAKFVAAALAEVEALLPVLHNYSLFLAITTIWYTPLHL